MAFESAGPDYFAAEVSRLDKILHPDPENDSDLGSGYFEPVDQVFRTGETGNLPETSPVELEAANPAPGNRTFTKSPPVKPQNNSSITQNVNTLNFVNIKIEPKKEEVTARKLLTTK